MAMTTETVWAALDALLDYAKNCGLLHPLDETFARNTILSELHLESYEKQEQRFDFPECLNLLCDYAAQQGMIADTIAERDLFDTKLMGVLTPRPHEVRTSFRTLYEVSPREATDWFYRFSQDTNYIRRDRIAKDKKWTYTCEYGTLDITINLPDQKIIAGNNVYDFDIDAFRKHCLINGLDDIGLTLEKESYISTYEENRSKERPWV